MSEQVLRMLRASGMLITLLSQQVCSQSLVTSIVWPWLASQETEGGIRELAHVCLEVCVHLDSASRHLLGCCGHLASRNGLVGGESARKYHRQILDLCLGHDDLFHFFH